MRAMGGVWGSFWTGQPTDDPAVYHLPESENDFIICVLGERYGLPGLAVLLRLFGFLVWRATAIANATLEPFGRLTAIGIAAMFAVEVLINVGMSVGLVPITGLALALPQLRRLESSRPRRGRGFAHQYRNASRL